MGHKVRINWQFLFLGKARCKTTGHFLELASIGNGVVSLLSLLPAFALFLALEHHGRALAVVAGLLLLLVLLPCISLILARFTGWVPVGSPHSEEAAAHSSIFFRGAILLLALIFGAIWLLST